MGFSAASFASAIQEYAETPNAKAADEVLSCLDKLAEVDEFNINDDVQQIELLSSFKTLLSTVDIHSSLAWRSLIVLESFCKSLNNARVLIHVQQLTPSIAKLMVSAITEERKSTILKMLQKATYGIKFVRPDSFLAPMISALISWSKASNSHATVQLSLSVLVNILHGNIPVAITLMKTVDLKKFMTELMHVKRNIKCRMEVCKVMFLIEDLVCEKQDESEIENFIKVTFSSVCDSGSQGSHEELQRSIYFFDDMVKSAKINVATLDKPWFAECVRNVLEQLHENTSIKTAMLLFRFLRIFVVMEVPALLPFSIDVIKECIHWVSKYEKLAGEAVSTLNAVINQRSMVDCNFDIEYMKLVFLPLLNVKEGTPSEYSFLGILLSFLKNTLEIKAVSNGIKDCLDIEAIKSIIDSLSHYTDFWNNFSTQEHIVEVYVHLLDFIHKVATCYSGVWMNLLSSLLRQERLIPVLAVALACGSGELKAKVLSLFYVVGFPRDCILQIANSMEKHDQRKPSVSSFQVDPRDVSMSQQIQKILKTIKTNEGASASSHSILQLYNYKERLNMDYQKSLLESLSKATEQIAVLQQEISITSQINSQLCQENINLHTAVDEMKSKYEASKEAFDITDKEFLDSKRKLNEEITFAQNQIRELKDTLLKRTTEIETLTANTKELKKKLAEKIKLIEELNEESQHLLKKTEELEAQIGKEEKMSQDITDLTQGLKNLERELQTRKQEVTALEQELVGRDKKIEELQRLREMVCELTSGKKLP